MVGLDDDIVALANREVKLVDRVRLYGDKVRFNDRHVVADDGNNKGVIGRGVDQPETMALVLCELQSRIFASSAVGRNVHPVEEDVVARRRRARDIFEEGIVGVHHPINDVLGGVIVPVADGEDAEVGIVRVGGRAVDLDWTNDAVGVLRGDVRVVPGTNHVLADMSTPLLEWQSERTKKFHAELPRTSRLCWHQEQWDTPSRRPRHLGCCYSVDGNHASA